MTIVIVRVLEMGEPGKPTTARILDDWKVKEFTQGAQFGETSEALLYAQKLVKAAGRLK